MMKRVLSGELPLHIGERVNIRGWLNNVRALGRVNFLIVRDRAGLAQVVIEDKEEFRKISSLHAGSILTIAGTVTRSEAASLGVEVSLPSIHVEVPVTDVPPLEYYRPEINADMDTILDYRALSLRNARIRAVFTIQAEIAHSYRLYMHDIIGATEYFGPNIIGASSEGGAEIFNVDYFGYPATLAQSSQLYKQVMVGVNERVFAIMPFFRAEPSHTSRHLTEGKQLEFEMGFFDHWHEIQVVLEGFIKYMGAHLSSHCRNEIDLLGGALIHTPSHVPFPRITVEEAQEIFFSRTGIDERSEPDLSPAAERELCLYAAQEYGTDCIFIVDWKTSKRPFYAYPNDRKPEISNTFDLLCGGSEVTSGGQRRHTYQSMVEGMRSKGMDPENFQDYLSIFKYGMPPHGGFGVGLERLTMTVLNLKNIREASLFPSDPRRIAGVRLRAAIFFGGESLRNEIIRLLKRHSMEFRHLVHDATPTSEDSARVRQTKLEEGVKSIILRGKSSKKNYHFNIPAHLKLDMKAVALGAGEKCEFEDPEIIRKRFGLPTGGVPPFGNLMGLPAFFDERVPENEQCSFNCGLQTESIVMRSKDLIELVQPMMGRYGKA
jgi:nondiscriminating aspartyl-tRNA synthetase